MTKIIVHDIKEKPPHPLSIHHIPLAFTFAFFNDTTNIVVDPTVFLVYFITWKRLEEEVMDGRVTFAVNIYKDICNVHKPGGAAIS
jgi:exosome complex component RRP45